MVLLYLIVYLASSVFRFFLIIVQPTIHSASFQIFWPVAISQHSAGELIGISKKRVVGS